MSGIQPEAHSIAMANSVVVPVGTFDTSADVEMSYEGHSDRDSKRSSWLSETSFTLERELMDLTNNDLDPMSDAEGPPVSDSASLSSLGFGFGETDASTSEVTADDDSQVGDEEGEFIDDKTLRNKLLKAQSSTDLLISKVTFRRLVMEVLYDITGSDQIRIQSTAVQALHEASEDRLTRHFRAANIAMQHAGREILTNSDMMVPFHIMAAMGGPQKQL